METAVDTATMLGERTTHRVLQFSGTTPRRLGSKIIFSHNFNVLTVDGC